jgi:benzodiazapine receptor
MMCFFIGTEIRDEIVHAPRFRIVRHYTLILDTPIRMMKFLVLALACFCSVKGFQVIGSPVAKPSIAASKRAPDYQRQGHQQQIRFRDDSVLFASIDGGLSAKKNEFDSDAVIKYGAALVTQLALFYGLFTGLDMIIAALGIVKVPFAVNCILFYATALKSRVFNPLPNNRPQPKTLETDGQKQQRVMPSWTPPGVVFPIVWLLLIAPLRAATSAMVYQTTLSYADPAIMALILHLSIGDIWNTINNVEKRYGVAVVGVLAVWLSKAHAAYQYYQVVPLAGKLLAASLIWLTIASALVTATWRLNPDPVTGVSEPLYPVTGKTKTTFAWGSKSD